MMDEDEPPLRGDFLRSVCVALNHNGIRSLKGAVVNIPDSLDLTPPKKPPQIERHSQRKEFKEGR